MLDVKIDGADSIDEDYKKFEEKVKQAAHAGLTAIGSELTKKLQQHIRKDVYAAYDPRSYPRRSDFPEFGEPLESPDYMDLNIGAMSLAFNYEPSGEHSGTQRDRLDWEDSFTKKFDTDPNAPLVPSPANGDDLMRLLEKGRKAYDWAGTEEIPARPFWSNFVQEAVGRNGWTDKVLARAMDKADRELNVKSDGNVAIDSGDTLFDDD